jgi:hypothetical protein
VAADRGNRTLPTLTLILPADVQGRSDLTIGLINIDGDLLTDTRMVLVIAPPVPAAVVPRPALPDKPVSGDEVAMAARINNWTAGLAGGLLEGTFSKYAADLGKALDDSNNLRVLPIISYGAVGNVTDLAYLKGVDFAITYADVLDYFKNVEEIPASTSASTKSFPCLSVTSTSTCVPKSNPSRI